MGTPDTGLAAMGCVLGYVLVTAPLLAVLLWVHRLRSDYTKLLLAALILQIIPIGLIFFPLGLVGMAVLAFTTVATLRRNARFRALAPENTEVHRRWTQEALANVLALGFAFEQKGIAWLLMDVTGQRGLAGLWLWLLPGSLVLWLALAPWLRREWRIFRAIGAAERPL